MYQQQGLKVLERLSTYQQVCEALVQARETKTDAFEAGEAVVSWETFVSTVRDRESATQTAHLDPMRHVLRSYGKLRAYAPRLLHAFEFRAAPASQPLVKAKPPARAVRHGQADPA